MSIIILAIISVTALVTGLNSSKQLEGGLGGSVNPIEQRQYLLAFPKHAYQILWEGSVKYLSFKDFLSNLGWLDTPLNGNLRDLYSKIFLSALLCDAFLTWATQKSIVKLKLNALMPRLLQALTLAAGALAGNTLLVYVLYLTWTPVGAHYVDGLQPRYFLFSYILLIAAVSLLLHDKTVNEVAVGPTNGQRLAQRYVLKIGKIATATTFSVLIVLISSQLAFTLSKRYW